MRTFTPSTLDLIATIRREKPASMNEAARAVERDVKNVHEQLTRLESLGVIYFAEEDQSTGEHLIMMTDAEYEKYSKRLLSLEEQGVRIVPERRE